MNSVQDLSPEQDTLALVFEVNKPLTHRIDAGDEFDVVIVLPSEIDELISRGKVVENSRARHRLPLLVRAPSRADVHR